MKYSITHCYTDKNKGDAAIIIATAQLIKKIDKNAKINMFSTYSMNDIRFEKEHKFIENYADNIYPACFYEPKSIIGLGDKSRILDFLRIFIKVMIVLISKNKFILKFILKKEEYLAIEEYLNSDIIISKGGSYITTQNKSIRQTLSLIRMLYPFLLAKRYNKKMYIFSQSLGPIEGAFNKWLFKFSLKKVKKIYLRESLCYEKYDYVKAICNTVGYKIIPDTAFYLMNNTIKNILDINLKDYNIGYTLVDHAFKYIIDKKEKNKKIDNYKNSIIKSIKYLIKNYNAIIHIFPQVLVDNSVEGFNDLKLSKSIKEYFKNTKYQDKVNVYEYDLSPIELKYLYSNMEIFVGTRLHSVIFSLSSCVPAINISYHGTKSKGILSNINIKEFDDYVIDIDEISSEKLIKTIEKLILNKNEIKNILCKTIPLLKKQLENAMKEIIYDK